ncbi:hypothetical protein F2Q69_00055851 [Brassica cretica]|uniref:Transposase MuDR plant domain-containing protein n=1 Tax=Brassica cretica TaxID=69181 RepID=A0A8S9MZB5_BRACR|nr:hypothetical protein F2Q69_00055851 [Brassica cretica]
MDYVNLTLCVAYGNVEVGRYHTMQREEFGLTEDGTDVVPPKPIPWRVSEEKLMTICSSEQMVEIRRNAVRLTRDEIFQPLMVVDENSPQTDSSDEMDIFTPNAEGMIRLEEIPTEPPAGANLTLVIATTNDVNGGRVGSYVKGKGVMIGPDIRGGQLFGLQMGSGSGFANTEGADVKKRKWAAIISSMWGQVFVDRDAKKIHMSLHALANKYIYFVRKSEPEKVVLECSGVNCQWRVYATKITGCPRLEIKTLDSNHRCTVSERGQFRRHATSSIVGGMMRGKYVGMIRLEEIPTEPPAGANLTLAIATTDDVDGGCVGSYGKGKGVMTGPDITGGQLFGLQMGSGSGFANTEGADVALEEDEAYAGEQKDEEEIGSNNQLYVEQVFVDRDAFKVHMSLHALANKYIYFVRKFEPGKVVYATKITGCPQFEIKTLDSNHRCTVSEQGQFMRHATSSIVRGMMRSKYVGTGSGPRPGALREMMRTDHSVPISYWTGWKSREIAIENGRGNVEAAYNTLPSYLQQLAMSGALKRCRTCSRCGGTDHNKVTCKMPI